MVNCFQPCVNFAFKFILRRYKLLMTAYKCLQKGIEQVKPGVGRCSLPLSNPR